MTNGRCGLNIIGLLITVLAGLSLAAPQAQAALSLTAGNNATTTPNVATSITGFQIEGPSASTTPVKIHATNGTLSVSSVDGVTISGNNSATISLSGSVTNLNAALTTLKYTRSNIGTDTLEVALVNANQIYWPGNGHIYEFVSTKKNWYDAKTAAAALTFAGISGYLATVTSDDENSFIYTRLAGDGWLGATDEETELQWKWATGPEAGNVFFVQNNADNSGPKGEAQPGWYAGWADGEPNDYDGNEDCGYMYSAQNGVWNDYPCSTSQGYVVEYGSDENPPSVVSAQVNIVTADVPAITSLSPANGASSISTTANLVMGFSKNVTPDSGDIIIKKAADDSLVESIAVSGAQVTGSGGKTITINPNTTLDESTQYYVLIPSQAFKDGSGNYFNGISANSTWSFTTGDFTAPTISALATSSVATTSAAISWSTDENASSRLEYGLTTATGILTSETDTSPRVMAHARSLSGLLSCTTYYFAAISRDGAGNTATSSIGSFTTPGCAGNNAASTVSTSTAITAGTSATSSVAAAANSTFSVAVTATSSSLVIQVRAVPSADILASIGQPTAAPTTVGSVVFDVKAIINNDTVLDSFDHPVTISYAYTDDQIAGLDENSLKLYHYHDNAWVPLDDCAVDAAGNTISCTTDSFSIFGLFGNKLTVGSSNQSISGTSMPERINYLIRSNQISSAIAMLLQYLSRLHPAHQSFAADTSAVIIRDLEYGMTGQDVTSLQKLLVEQNIGPAAQALAKNGPTEWFGSLTRQALIEYQRTNGIQPAAGYFGKATRAEMKEKGLGWW